MESQQIETENILFNYFKHLKIWKYFVRADTPQHYCRDYEMKDISYILNNCGLSELEQTTLVYYGMALKPPRQTSRYYSIWKMAIERITIAFKKHRIIK